MFIVLYNLVIDWITGKVTKDTWTDILSTPLFVNQNGDLYFSDDIVLMSYKHQCYQEKTHRLLEIGRKEKHKDHDTLYLSFKCMCSVMKPEGNTKKGHSKEIGQRKGSRQKYQQHLEINT